MSEAVGFLIREYRCREGITQMQLAERTGVSGSVIKQLESNARGERSYPSGQTLSLLMGVMGERVILDILYQIREEVS